MRECAAVREPVTRLSDGQLVLAAVAKSQGREKEAFSGIRVWWMGQNVLNFSTERYPLLQLPKCLRRKEKGLRPEWQQPSIFSVN